jgi:phosphoribosylformylglycinamidine synthase
MILFFRAPSGSVYAAGAGAALAEGEIPKLTWLFGGAQVLTENAVDGPFVGPRREMISPWSTNAVEITQTMGIPGITRIEEFIPDDGRVRFDRMLMQRYPRLDQDLYTIRHQPEPVKYVEDLSGYNEAEGLALSAEEIRFLESVSADLGRKLTDSEVFGFSQVNSEHCRHKTFNGTFIIDGEEQPSTLFQLIKKTSSENPNLIVSAYKDNVAFIRGPRIEQFAPARQDRPDYFRVSEINSVISLKAETHNFPTTVEPFNGAATGSGGEIRDRLAGGKGALPLAGTAVYITSYPRLGDARPWEACIPEREWLYQTPREILIKASDGASDFGNKFGQPLITGSTLTFEHQEGDQTVAFDKVIMLAGGIGFGKAEDCAKGHLSQGDSIVLLGGDNYRIGMGGGAVSSVSTGEYGNAIELNAIQRSNPEMQKRVMNAIRAMVEAESNPIITIHDHGAGGHLNCFSELLEETGGTIHLDKLPVGDPTLSAKEVISNESQERMGLGIHPDHLDLLKSVSDRERAPMYVVGEAGKDQHLQFKNHRQTPVDLKISHLFGSSPRTLLSDKRKETRRHPISYTPDRIEEYLKAVLRLESVACKDWLTNKVDRSVTGKVALQQTSGPVQLPLNNLGIMALDFNSNKGVGTAIGHAPAAALVNAAAGSRLSMAEALTNLVFAPLTHGLKGVSLSANWMWPARLEGENARLYDAVKAVSDFAIALRINVPTGKDSLSMVQKYPGGTVVPAPGTVIISAVAEVEDIRKSVQPALQPEIGSQLIYVDFSGSPRSLGGSALAQILNQPGDLTPDVADPSYFALAFAAVQKAIRSGQVLAGHDVSSGGLITALLEMAFPQPGTGLELSLPGNEDLVLRLFSENPAIVLQAGKGSSLLEALRSQGVDAAVIGMVIPERVCRIRHGENPIDWSIDELRDIWFSTSYLLDREQRKAGFAELRRDNYKRQPLIYSFPTAFDGRLQKYGIDRHRRKPSGLKAAIIREKGVNGDREMAWSLYLAGFDVKDVHMTDLVSGRETLADISMIVFVGGFSNSDVLGSAKGWAGAFLYNPKAKETLDRFYSRSDTLSLGVCNGCQLMMELGLLNPMLSDAPKMLANASGKFESAFINVTIPENNSVMLGSLAGARLGVWVAHGEGRFSLPKNPVGYRVAARYSYREYPGNPNGSDDAVAALCSADGRHLAIMPHLERSLYPWNWGYYPAERGNDEVSPWIEAFANAVAWVRGPQKGS